MAANGAQARRRAREEGRIDADSGIDLVDLTSRPIQPQETSLTRVEMRGRKSRGRVWNAVVFGENDRRM